MDPQSLKAPSIPADWRAEIVAIGCSTGGPVAVQKVLQALSKSALAPIVIAQHMPKGFTAQFAERLNTVCVLDVMEGQNGTILKAGTVYISPASYITRVVRKADGRLSLDVQDANPQEWLYRPSVDLLLSSAAAASPHQVLAVVMTGMGRDGTKGAQAVRETGGYVVTESAETAVIYGMPKSVYEAGHSNLQVPLQDIAGVIQRYAI